MGTGGAEKQALLASLRLQVRALEAELGSGDETVSGPADPRTLTARERLLTEAERISHVGSWAWHPASNSVFWSDEMFRIFGVDPGKHGDLFEAFFATVHADDLARVRGLSEQLRTAGHAPPAEFRIIRPDGSERVVRSQAAVVPDAEGVPARFVGTIHDLTELRVAEQARQRDHEMLRGAEALAGVGSYRWVPSTGELVWSDQFKVIAGLPPDAVPSFDQFLALMDPEDRPVLLASTARALERHATESLPARLIWPDGSIRYVILQGQFVSADEMLGSMLDVTEVRRLEANLFQAQKLEALGRLAVGIAHDFNNILAVLELGLEAQGELLPDLRIAIDRGASLTRQLLAFGRTNVLEPQPVDLGDLLRQSVAMVGRLLGDAVTARLAPELERLVVDVDPTQLQHTLINLLTNARDAMPRGGSIWLSARSRTVEQSPPEVKPPLAPGDYVELQIRDEGTGIDAAVVPHIFEPFFTTKPRDKGTGLGLATVFGTVSQSGGGIEVQSRPGSGTTFRIYLPRSKREPAPPAAKEQPKRAVRSGARILVVDDRAEIRNVISQILTAAGFEAINVADPRVLVSEGTAASCQALITDLDMPDVTGVELAGLLWLQAPALPVLFMSGYQAPIVPKTSGAPTGFVAKPFSSRELLDALSDLLDEGRH